MTDAEILCCPDCGTVLGRVVSGRTIATPAADPFPFTRSTDHVTCGSCDAVVPIRELRADLPPLGGIPETLHELAAEEEPGRTVPRQR